MPLMRMTDLLGILNILKLTSVYVPVYTTMLRSLSYFVRRIPKSSGNVLCLRLSRISYVICISYVISIVVISRSALNVLCLLLYPRNHWQHHVNKVKSSSCSS